MAELRCQIALFDDTDLTDQHAILKNVVAAIEKVAPEGEDVELEVVGQRGRILAVCLTGSDSAIATLKERMDAASAGSPFDNATIEDFT